MVRKRKANVIPDFGITFHPFGAYTTKGVLKAWFGWESQVTLTDLMKMK